MDKNKIFSLGAAWFILFSVLTLSAQNANELGDLFKEMEWRSVGPALMGGRTVDIESVPGKPWILYAAIGPSGLWKSENAGTTWEPVFDHQNTVSIGDVAVAPSQPDTVWVGTGEATARNSVTIGDGIYKSTDGGKTWTHQGLTETRHISRILIHPENPDIIYVAAAGHLWGPNQERGVYRTTDGGNRWQKVLYSNPNTGIADMAIDPSNPDILYAAAWEYQRFPYYFYSGGPQSGIYKTTDGGSTWKKLVNDLPQGVLGRIGMAVSPSRPEVVYALIEHEDGGIWRTEDRGETWTRMCDNDVFITINFRPFYYSRMTVDPNNDEIIYVYSGGLYVSKNKGKKFRPISQGTHPDHHTLWVNPENSLNIIDGNDGGIDISYDAGQNWRPVQNMALAEVYQLGFDLEKPYHVYCGLQDNGVWGGPNETWDTAGIVNADWYNVGSGDGFYCQVDPKNPDIVYANSQMNGLYRFNRNLGRSKDIKPRAPLDEPPYRFNWNSPVLISPHDNRTIFTGGNFLFMSIDRGNSWEKISPDLTTDNPEKQNDSGGPITLDNTGAEVHCTIYTIAESPLQKDLIWCGTDDGNVQITRNGGETWMETAKNISGLPPASWCSRIEASHFDPGTAYAAFDNHRRDDYETYLFRTTDYGATWHSIKGNLPFGWVHVVREDPVNKELLYAGTEFGIYASLDGGESWLSVKNNLPTVAVRDIAVHPEDNDLIIGTHGRGIWILDDISPLQKMDENILNKSFYIFPIRPVTAYFPSTRFEAYSQPEFSGKNPIYGMPVNIYFRKKPQGRNTIVIKDSKGQDVFEMRLLNKQGLHRYHWNFQFIPKTTDGNPIKPGGIGMVSPPIVLSGTYRIELHSQDKITAATTVQVLKDPRVDISAEARKSQIQAQVEAMALSKKMGLAVTAVRKIRRDLGKRFYEDEETEERPDDIRTALETFEENFQPLEETIMPKGIGYRGSLEMALRGGSISQQILMLGMSIGNYPAEPTKTDLSMLKELTGKVNALVNQLNQFIAQEIAGLNQVLEDNGMKPIKAPDKIDI
jgi:photosystem II stability/assembly factor-like uncharacterized protein